MKDYYTKKQIKELQELVSKLEYSDMSALNNIDPHFLAMAINKSIELDGGMKSLEKQIKMIRPDENEVPKMSNIDFGYFLKPVNNIGADHIAFVDFKNRYDLDKLSQMAIDKNDFKLAEKIRRNALRSGFLIFDVEGHDDSNAPTVFGLHHTFFAFAKEKLRLEGILSSSLMEDVSVRAIESTSIDKPATMLYGDIREDGLVRYLSAGHPHPKAFSYNFDSFVPVANHNGEKVESVFSIGYSAYSGHSSFNKIKDRVTKVRSERMKSNEYSLQGAGDILIVASDGVFGHKRPDGKHYFDKKAQKLISKVKDNSAQEIADALKTDLLNYSMQEDDMSAIIIKTKRN